MGRKKEKEGKKFWRVACFVRVRGGGGRKGEGHAFCLHSWGRKIRKGGEKEKGTLLSSKRSRKKKKRITPFFSQKKGGGKKKKKRVQFP